MSLKIFDSHVHMGFWGTQTIHEKNIDPLQGREMESSEKLLAHLKKSQIEKAVVVPMYLPDKRMTYAINNLVFETAQTAPDVVIPGFWVDPSPEVIDLLHETLDSAEEKGIRVLKMSAQTWSAAYSPDPISWDHSFAEAIKQILKYARNTNSVIQIHTGSNKSDIRNIEKLVRFAGPEVRFHLVHMGYNTDGHFYLIPRLSDWLTEKLNVVCDTSWSRGFAVRWLMRLSANDCALGKSIMFGSDEPWGIFQSEIAKVVDAAGKNLELLEAVLWKNALRVYCGRTKTL